MTPTSLSYLLTLLHEFDSLTASEAQSAIDRAMSSDEAGKIYWKHHTKQSHLRHVVRWVEEKKGQQ